jgi:hypothetical protein
LTRGGEVDMRGLLYALAWLGLGLVAAHVTADAVAVAWEAGAYALVAATLALALSGLLAYAAVALLIGG